LRATARWSWALFIFERPSIPSLVASLYSCSFVRSWLLRLVLGRADVVRADELRVGVLRPVEVLRVVVLRPAVLLRPDEVLRPDVVRPAVLLPPDDDVLRLAVLRVAVLRAAVPRFAAELPPLRLDVEREDDLDVDAREELLVSPAFVRCLLTVRAAISFARLVDSPFFFSLSLTCSY
jgi:hypothetical protein